MANWRTYQVNRAIELLHEHKYGVQVIGEMLYVYSDGHLIERIWIKDNKVRGLPIDVLIRDAIHKDF